VPIEGCRRPLALLGTDRVKQRIVWTFRDSRRDHHPAAIVLLSSRA
jgi:hypothetical protein